MKAFLLGASLFLAACGSTASSDAAVEPDGSLTDAGAIDAGAIDAGGRDASADDAGTDAGPDDAGSAPLPEHRALFVGNSYTFFNDLPSLYGTSLESLPRVPDPIAIESSTAGGRRLVEHLTDARTMGHRLHGWLNGDVDWTHVVLQEQSQIPGFGPGQPDFEQSRLAAAELATLATARGARVIFFVTWGRREGDPTNPGLFGDFTAMQDRLDAGYALLADEARAAGAEVALAPVGGAFRAVHDGEVDPLAPDARFYGLYDADGSHPSLAGSYLAACVLVATMLELDATEIAHVPAGLEPTEAAALREAAQAAIATR